MTPDPVTIEASASAQELIELARRTGHTAYPVIDDYGDAIGLASVLAAERLPERRWPVSVRELLAQVPQPNALEADAEVLSVVPALAATPPIAPRLCVLDVSSDFFSPTWRRAMRPSAPGRPPSHGRPSSLPRCAPVTPRSRDFAPG